MTPLQREQIADLRNQNIGYGIIAKKLGISKDRVKSYCRIHGLTGFRSLDVPKEKIGQEFCMNCGTKLIHSTGKKRKKFCSDQCRISWWNSHLNKVNRKAFYHFTCTYCGKRFKAYGNKNRKYCSPNCYIQDRFYTDEECHEERTIHQ